MPFVYLFFICIYNYCTSYTKFHNKNNAEFTCQHCFCTTNFNFNFFLLKVEFNFSVQRIFTDSLISFFNTVIFFKCIVWIIQLNALIIDSICDIYTDISIMPRFKINTCNTFFSFRISLNKSILMCMCK